MIDLDTALARIIALLPKLATEEIPLDRAMGRYLVQPVVAQLSQPPFDASAMDGYAVRANEAKAGITLTQIGVSQAGAGFDGVIGERECVRIFTGAPVPEGCDCIVIQENATARGDQITLNADGEPGQHIRRKGNDFAQGDTVLEPGRCLSAVDIGLAAAANTPSVGVSGCPRIALLSTGDELVAPGSATSAHQIIASNAVALKALLAPFSAEVRDFGIVGDDSAALGAVMTEIFDNDFDLVLTSGGASVGDHDMVQPVLRSLGVEIDFWKIAMRPGKPLLAGRKGKTTVIGLPGNPVSALVTAHVVVLPVLRAMMGAADRFGAQPRLPLAAPLPANGPRRHFWRAQTTFADGVTQVLPANQTDSAHLSSLSESDLLIVIEENAPARAIGEMVTCIQLNPAR